MKIFVLLENVTLSETVFFDIVLGQKLCYPILSHAVSVVSSETYLDSGIENNNLFRYLITGVVESILEKNYQKFAMIRSGRFYFLLNVNSLEFLKKNDFVSGKFDLKINRNGFQKIYDKEKMVFQPQWSCLHNSYHIWEVKTIQRYSPDDKQIYYPRDFVDIAAFEGHRIMDDYIIGLELLNFNGLSYLNDHKANPNDIEKYNFL